MADEVGGRAADVLDGPRNVVREVAEGQPVEGGRAAVDASVAHADGAVPGGFEVGHEGVEIADAASERRDADHEVSVASDGHVHLAVSNGYAHGCLLSL